MSLNDVVNVTISAETKTVSQAGFGTPLIYGRVPWLDVVRTYTDPSDLLTDDVPAASPVYLAAQRLFAQNPRPASFKVGRRSAAFDAAYEIRLVGSVVEGKVYSLSYQGLDATGTLGGPAAVSYTAGAGETASDVLTALALLLPDDAASNGTRILIELDASDRLLSFTNLKNLTYRDVTVLTTSEVTDLAAIREEDDDWYGLLTPEIRGKNIAGIAAWVESQVKLYAAWTSDDDCGTSANDDVLSLANAAGYARTFIQQLDSSGIAYPDAGWLGQMLARPPGSATWKFKTLAGVPVGKYTPTQLTHIKAKKGNWYTNVGGVNITQEGWTSSGEFIDITHGSDWLRARVQENVYATLVNNPKVAFTDSGVDVIRSAVIAQLELGIQRQFLAATPAPVVTFPLVASVSQNDRAARFLPDGEFVATLAGAIHATEIRGRLLV